MERHTIWFNRVVLSAATLLMGMIGVRGLFDPIGSSAVHAITLGSADGVTVARVGFGGFPMAVAIILLGCVRTERRLLKPEFALLVASTTALVLERRRRQSARGNHPSPMIGTEAGQSSI
jgi:hypothetical protein